jgi:signal transduction histidine kinase
MSKSPKNTQQQLELLINSIDGVVWGFDLQSYQYTFISHQLETLLPGVNKAALDNPNFFYEYVHPEDKPIYRQEFMDKVKEKKSFQLEYRLETENKKTLYIRDVITPVQSNGKTTYVTGIMFDVTRYKEATQQNNQLEVQLRQAQKLEAVGQLAAGIAHEINTPIQFVGDNLHFLMGAIKDLQTLNKMCTVLFKSAADNSAMHTKMEEIERFRTEIEIDFLLDDMEDAINQSVEGTQRVASIVKAMKSFSHPGTSDKESIDLNEAIDNTITVARNEWKYVAEVETHYDSELPLIRCFPGEINQTILNMVVNAAHAIEDKQKTTGNTAKGLIKITTSRRNDQAVLEISDDGCGINDAHKQKIFDPFFTTKEVGKGTGQGLAMAYNVIKEKHGGTLKVDSTPGIGTCFEITLPF